MNPVDTPDAAAPQLPAFLHQPMRLRPGCRLALQQFRGEPSYILEDTLSGEFFRIGLLEERLVRRLDGSLTGIGILEAIDPEDDAGLGAREVIILLSMLRAAGLLEGCPPDELSPPSLLRRAIAKNPLFLRIPVGNPDPLLTRAERWVRWMFEPWFVLLASALLVAALLAIAGDWQRFSDRAQSVLASDNWLWLAVAFLGLKLVHEAGHGLVCKHFGGRIPEFGIYFMFFTPLTYVDATSSWAFPSRQIRMLVAAAGMIAEILVAAVAALVWASTEAGVLNTLAYNTIFSATVVTLLFNLNPLLRYDGYYILSDLTGVPNLYSRAGAAASQSLRWLVFGTRPEEPEELWITAYGIACMVWRALLTLSICVGAVVLLQGIGILLAVLYVVGLSLPLAKKWSAATLPRGREAIRPAAVLCLAALALCIPVRQTITAPAVVQAADLTSIRVECPGFLRELTVAPGDAVESGELLARLENPEEIARMRTVRTLTGIAEVEAHRARLDRNPHVEAKKVEEIRSLEAQEAEREAYCATLEIRAPHAGIVVGREISNLLGSFLPTGHELFSIGSATGREVHILIPEEYAQVIRGKPGDSVRVFLRNQGRALDATLVRIEPRANRKIRFPQVTASAGGPIAIRRQEQPGAETTDAMEMVQPHFVAVATLVDPPPLLSGETCLVRLQSQKSRPLAIYVWDRIERLIRHYAGSSEPA